VVIANALRLGGCAVALLVWLAGAGAAAGATTNVEQCLAIAAEFNLGAALPRTATKLRAGQPVTIVALGSSSTSGIGGFGHSYPAALKAELARLHPSVRPTVINSGRAFETLHGNLAGLPNAVQRYRPDLVVWQLGTNDVVWRRDAGNAGTLLRAGVRQLKRSQADVILMDLQDAPVVRRRPAHIAMENMIAEVARTEAVGLFPRFLLMRRALADGVIGLVSWDGLHNSAAGYRCIGAALARMIDAKSRR